MLKILVKKKSFSNMRSSSNVAWKICCAQWQIAQSEVAMGKTFLNAWDSSSKCARGSPVKVLHGKLDSLLGGGKGNVPEPKEERLKDSSQRASSFC